MTMTEFAQFIGGVLQAPVTDQTGLTGTYDIALTPPRTGGGDGMLERVTGILKDELGLQLVPYAGPFTAEESPVAGRAVNIQIQADGGLVSTISTNLTMANAGFAIRLDHAGAAGLTASTGDSQPLGRGGDGVVLAGLPGGRGGGLNTEGLPQKLASKLRQIDSSKQQWALERHKRNTDTPSWEDLRPYLQGKDGDMSAFMNAPEDVYVLGSVGMPPKLEPSLTYDFKAALAADAAATVQNVCINTLRRIDSAKQQWALENGKQIGDTPLGLISGHISCRGECTNPGVSGWRGLYDWANW
jgi:hypothetical protein